MRSLIERRRTKVLRYRNAPAGQSCATPYKRRINRIMTSFAAGGCVAIAVCWPRPVLSHETLTTTVLFDREIVRVLNSHCVMCHVEGGPSFPLSTYEQTWIQGRKIRAEVIARHMPPWAAVPGYGQFLNDNSVTLRESQFVVSWVEGLGPRNGGTVFTNVVDSSAGRPKEVRAHVDFGRWQLGTPDFARPLAANIIEPTAGDAIRRTVTDLGLTTPRRVRALEYVPGDRRVVRAAFFTVQETGQWIGSWTPWYGVVTLPKEAAYQLAAGSHVVAEVHYRAAKERVVDHGTLGLFFADAPTPRTVADLVIDAPGEVLPGTGAQGFRAATTLAKDTSVLALWPEVRPGVTSIEVSARKPDGTIEVLLFAKDIPLEWPTPYLLKHPTVLRRGTDLIATAYYGNTTAAPQPGGMHLTVSAYENTPGPTVPKKRK
jgi:hypothetical protein